MRMLAASPAVRARASLNVCWDPVLPWMSTSVTSSIAWYVAAALPSSGISTVTTSFTWSEVVVICLSTEVALAVALAAGVGNQAVPYTAMVSAFTEVVSALTEVALWKPPWRK